MERVGGSDRLALVVGREAIGRVGQAHLVALGEPLELDEVVEPLVAGRRRDQEHGVGILQPSDELDGQLDALARHDPRRLHDQQPVLAHPELGAQPPTNGGRSTRAGTVEVEHVRDDRRANVLAARAAGRRRGC